MKFYKGSFTANTSTGVQTVTGIVDELGAAFTPQGVVIWTNYITAAGFSDAQGALWQIGMAGATGQITQYGRSADNVSPTDCDRSRSTTAICQIRSLTGTNVRVGTFNGFGSGQFGINWTTADAVAALFHFVAIGDVDNCEAVEIETLDPSSQSAATIFRADFGIFAMNATDNDFWGSGCIGWMAQTSGAVTQGAVAVSSRDNVATAKTSRFQSDARCTASLNNAADAALFCAYRWGSLGFDATTASTSANVQIAALMVRGARAYAGVLTQPTGTGTQAITDPGFRPKGILMASFGRVPSTASEVEHRLSLGAADATRQGWGWTGDADTVNPSVCAGGYDASNLVVMGTPAATGSGSTIEAQASLSSFDANGFTLNWGTADATARQVIYLVLGQPAVAGVGETSYPFILG